MAFQLRAVYQQNRLFTARFMMSVQAQTLHSHSQSQSAHSVKTKVLVLVRHGQAMHNVRAEPLKAKGCTFQEFLDQMKQDDALDADLTETGRTQAHEAATIHKHITPGLQLVVASTLSRAVDTADLVFPHVHTPLVNRRVALEEFREISGLLLNGKRNKLSLLRERYPQWDLSNVEHEDDPMWEEQALEQDELVAGRITSGLRWLWEQAEENVAVVCHGGILKHMLQRHEHVHCEGNQAAFTNCEVRRYHMSFDTTLDKFVLKQNEHTSKS
eukprot:m.46148 g.46148  ORF g.46148 m.46148 type:complete len:271 (-) comp20160_c0_seq3:188-1000(-)